MAEVRSLGRTPVAITPQADTSEYSFFSGSSLPWGFTSYSAHLFPFCRLGAKQITQLPPFLAPPRGTESSFTAGPLGGLSHPSVPVRLLVPIRVFSQPRCLLACAPWNCHSLTSFLVLPSMEMGPCCTWHRSVPCGPYSQTRKRCWSMPWSRARREKGSATSAPSCVHAATSPPFPIT